MKYVIKICSISLVILLLAGCAGAGDYSISLPGGYSILRKSAHDVVIAKKDGESSWGSDLISAKVVQVGYDDKFILAKQLGLKRKYPDNPDSTYEITDKSKVYYWILQIENEKKYGPLSEEEFKHKKKELNISDKLILKNVEDYKTS